MAMSIGNIGMARDIRELQKQISSRCPDLEAKFNELIDGLMGSQGDAGVQEDVRYVICMKLSDESGSYYHPAIMPNMDQDAENIGYMLSDSSLEDLQEKCRREIEILRGMPVYGEMSFVAVPEPAYLDIEEKLNSLLSEVMKACKEIMAIQYRMNAMLGRYMDMDASAKQLAYSTLSEIAYTGNAFTANKEVVDRTGALLEQDKNRKLEQAGEDPYAEDEYDDEGEDDYDEDDDSDGYEPDDE